MRSETVLYILELPIKEIENERKMEKGWMVIKGNQQEQHINCGCWSAQFVG